MDRICRICLASEVSREFTEIYKMHAQKIALKIFLISHVKIVEFKESPALVCAQCVKELYQCIQFRKKIQTSDEYFRASESDLWKISIDNDEEAGGDNNKEFDSLRNSEELDNEIEALDEDFEYEALGKIEPPQPEEEVMHSEFTIKELQPLAKRRGRKVKNVKRNYKRLACKVCGITLSRRQRLVQHERLHFIDVTKSFYECDDCGKRFNQRFSLIPHFQKYHSFKLGPKERWRCAICDDKSLPAGKMELHYKKMHSEFWSDPRGGDSQKNIRFESSQASKRRKKTVINASHKNSKNWFLCGICGNSFTSSYRYHKHLNDIHGVAEHEVVSKNVSVPAVIDNQEIKISNNVPCQICGKVFASVRTCKAHEKTHLNVKYVCDLCGNSFKVKVRISNFISLFIYSKNCLLQAYLTAHVQKIHLKLKRFRCTICSQEFIHRELLNYHVRYAL